MIGEDNLHILKFWMNGTCGHALFFLKPTRVNRQVRLTIKISQLVLCDKLEKMLNVKKVKSCKFSKNCDLFSITIKSI